MKKLLTGVLLIILLGSSACSQSDKSQIEFAGQLGREIALEMNAKESASPNLAASPTESLEPSLEDAISPVAKLEINEYCLSILGEPDFVYDSRDYEDICEIAYAGDNSPVNGIVLVYQGRGYHWYLSDESCFPNGRLIMANYPGFTYQIVIGGLMNENKDSSDISLIFTNQK